MRLFVMSCGRGMGWGRVFDVRCCVRMCFGFLIWLLSVRGCCAGVAARFVFVLVVCVGVLGVDRVMAGVDGGGGIYGSSG